jgi:serine/threonine protein kinase
LYAVVLAYRYVQDNIFITDDGLGSAQIADFGLAVIADAATNGMSASSGPRGTVAWMAPERFHITDNTTRFATSVDVYSFGMLCYAV